MATKAFSCPLDVRQAIRANRLTGFASRALPGYLCVNVVFMHRQYAQDFAAFCEANPKPCPLLFTTEPGQTDCPDLAEELDLCTDLGSYDIIRNGGVTEQRQDVVDLFDEVAKLGDFTYQIVDHDKYGSVFDRIAAERSDPLLMSLGGHWKTTDRMANAKATSAYADAGMSTCPAEIHELPSQSEIMNPDI